MSDIFDMQGAMAFREKSAWISLLATLAIYGAYFVFYARGVAFGGPFAMSAEAGLAVVALVVLQIIGLTVVSILSPREAKAPEDERERMIQLRARSAAYLTLQVGAVAAAASVYFARGLGEGGGWVIANVVFGALAVAQVIQYLAVILGYRRGV